MESDTHQHIDDLVFQYRNGNAEAGEELLIRFAPYLAKWNRLLIRGTWDFSDTEVQDFLRICSMGPGPVDLLQTAEVLQRVLSTFYDQDDLLQELRVCLLETARRYTNITASFRYVLRDRILRRGPENSRGLLEETLLHTRLGLGGEVEACADSLVEATWVEGITCGPAFRLLTAEQRYILRAVYQEGLTDLQVAERLGKSERTVRRQRWKAKKHLAQALGLN